MKEVYIHRARENIRKSGFRINNVGISFDRLLKIMRTSALNSDDKDIFVNEILQNIKESKIYSEKAIEELEEYLRK